MVEELEVVDKVFDSETDSIGVTIEFEPTASDDSVLPKHKRSVSEKVG